jgi:putative transposase
VDGIPELNRPQLEPWTRGKRWIAKVNHPLPETDLTAIRNSAQRGAPFGKETWVRTLAAKHGLESTLRPRGRPRKIQSDD